MVNAIGKEVEGEFTWNTPDEEVNKGIAYSWTFTPTDLEHYDVVKGKSIVWEEEKEPEVPVEPGQPEKPTEPSTPEKPDNTIRPDNTTNPIKLNKADMPKTGDMTNLEVFASMLIGSSGALAVLLGKRRKSNKND